MPARLSGGQAHRVALGRLLLAHCDTLLLDEPYTGLDAALRRVLTGLVAGLVAAREVPAVLVTHELADAQAFADRLAVLDAGRLLQAGPPPEVVRSARQPAGGRAGRLPRIRAGQGRAGRSVVPELADGGDLVAGIHPERITPGAHPAAAWS